MGSLTAVWDRSARAWLSRHCQRAPMLRSNALVLLGRGMNGLPSCRFHYGFTRYIDNYRLVWRERKLLEVHCPLKKIIIHETLPMQMEYTTDTYSFVSLSNILTASSHPKSGVPDWYMTQRDMGECLIMDHGLGSWSRGTRPPFYTRNRSSSTCAVRFLELWINDAHIGFFTILSAHLKRYR